VLCVVVSEVACLLERERGVARRRAHDSMGASRCPFDRCRCRPGRVRRCSVMPALCLADLGACDNGDGFGAMLSLSGQVSAA
jgi:hypothetical protein